MKRALTILLALVLMMAMAVPAMAAGQGSITIDNAVKDNTYTIYRIFDLDSHNYDYTGVIYKVNPAWANFFKEGAKGLDYVNIDELGYVTWKEGADAAQFAKDAFTFASQNGIPKDGEKTATYGELNFDNLELGYYLVHSSLDALCSLDTTTPSVTIKEKNAKPTTEKEVEEDSNSSFGGHNDADIGQTVNFKTTINVIDGQPKNYVLHDKMSDGLTFDGSSVKVTVNGEPITTGFTITTAADDECTFEVRFTDGTLKVNDVVVVTYSATLNANAVVGGTGNANETHLSYTNTDNTTGKTQPSETRTYTWSMDVLKYTEKDDMETGLGGAEFVLYKKTEDDKQLYALAANGMITGWTNEASKATVFASAADGKIEIKGLDADTYYLEEIKEPAGYNRLKDPIRVDITATIDPATNAGTATVTYGEGSTGTVKVLNQAGAELPSTGGIGTTVFYVVGGLLVAVAVVLLVTKKKMSVNK